MQKENRNRRKYKYECNTGSAPRFIGARTQFPPSFNQENQGLETRSRMRIRFCSRIRIRFRLVGAAACPRPFPDANARESRGSTRGAPTVPTFKFCILICNFTFFILNFAFSTSPLLEFATRNSYNSYPGNHTSNSLPAHCRSSRQDRWVRPRSLLKHSDP